MKKLQKFNEFLFENNKNDINDNKILLTKEDILNSELIGEVDEYEINDGYCMDSEYTIEYDFEGSKYKICQFYMNEIGLQFPSEFGWVVFKDDKLIYTIYVNEPSGEKLVPEKDMIVFYGSEEIVNFWFNGFYKVVYQR